MKNNLRNQKGEDQKSFLDYRMMSKIVINHWTWFLLSMLICITITYLYIRCTSPVYSVIAKILIKDDEGNKKNNLQNISDLGTISQNYGLENEAQILTSSIIAERAVTDLQLYKQYRQKGRFFGKTCYRNTPIVVDIDSFHLNKIIHPIQLRISRIGKRYQIKVNYYIPINEQNIEGPFNIEKETEKLPLSIHTRAGVLTIKRASSILLEEHTTMMLTISSPQTIAAQYANKMIIEPTSESSSVIKLIMNDKLPQRAKDYLKQVILCYNLQANEDKNEVAVRTETFINDRLNLINRELGLTDGNIETYKRSNKLVELKTDARESSANANIFEQKLKEANTQIALINEIESIVEQYDISQLLPSISLKDVAVNTFINEYNKMVMDRNRLLHSASESSPIIQSMTTRLKELSSTIYTSLQQAKTNAIITRNAMAEQHGNYLHEISKTPERERILAQIGRQQEVKSGLYMMLLQKREENSISLAATVDKGKIIERPTIAGIIKPKSIMLYSFALLLGFLLPSLFFYIRYILRNKVEDHEEVKTLTNLPILADIPMANEREVENNCIVVHENENNLMEESFRFLRTNLRFMLKDKEKVILFTSTVSNEGKTFNAINTAMSFALLGKKTLLVGLDIRNPQLSELFIFKDHREGITSLLKKDEPSLTEINEQITPSKIHKNLDLLLTGIIPPNPAELVSRLSLDIIFKQLRCYYDYIIVDSAPVGLVTDTLQIGRVCDLTAYVCKIGYTTKNSFTLINSLNEERKLPNVGIIINGVDLSSKNNVYTYGYGQYHGLYFYGNHYIKNKNTNYDHRG